MGGRLTKQVELRFSLQLVTALYPASYQQNKDLLHTCEHWPSFCPSDNTMTYNLPWFTVYRENNTPTSIWQLLRKLSWNYFYKIQFLHPSLNFPFAQQLSLRTTFPSHNFPFAQLSLRTTGRERVVVNANKLFVLFQHTDHWGTRSILHAAVLVQ